jgi:hypothetical protein
VRLWARHKRNGRGEECEAEELVQSVFLHPESVK